MKYCNINIQEDTKRFRYVVEYNDNIEYQDSDSLSYSVNPLGDDPLRVDFFEGDSYSLRNNNYWVTQHVDTVTQYIPGRYNISSANLYFPTNSVESFTNNNLYALTVNTWIHGHIVYLGNYIIDRRDAIACKRETLFLNSRYFEYINVKFIDPWYLTYSEDWKLFRQKVCGEKEGETELNDTGSVLNFTLYPIVWNEDRYIKLDPYIGSQNAINISDSVSDYIGSDIELIDGEEGKTVHCSIRFNRDYSTYGIQTFDDFKLYMKETYDVDGNIKLAYNLLVVDKDNIYKVATKDNMTELSCDFTSNDIYFGSWEGWKEGLRFILNVDIYEDTKPYVPADAVDMGLSVYWRKYNVGANNEFEVGNYYAWGETEPKDFYDWNTYKYGESAPFEKYNNGELNVLESEDDVAYRTLGEGWKTPSTNDFQELLDKCSYTVQIDYKGSGVNGILFTSQNGNELFLPFTGFKLNDLPPYTDSYGYMWTNELAPQFDSVWVYMLSFDQDNTFVSSYTRQCGLPVRPVYPASGEREDIMLLRSNTISITQDVMKYFIDGGSNLDIPKYVNLDLIDMKNYTINAVNKIEKKIIQIDKPTDTKANLIKPVYYRTYELSNIILHPAVTENICINLDAYKSTVDTFFIRVENATFVETARTNTGVIFKIVGANLAGEVGQGTFYILNQDKELITTGKFTYVS